VSYKVSLLIVSTTYGVYTVTEAKLFQLCHISLGFCVPRIIQIGSFLNDFQEERIVAFLRHSDSVY